MNISKILILNVIGLLFMVQNSNAMNVGSESEEAHSRTKITISGATVKPSAVTIESTNLFMRNISSEADLDYYTKIFSNAQAMEKYMNGIPRPQEEINRRHRKYLTWWEQGTAFTSYLVFLNEEASLKFLKEQERALQTHGKFLEARGSEKVPLILTQPDVTLRFLQKEFELTKKLFVGHVLLEPGEDRKLETDAEVSYVSLPLFWNNGFVTEAVGNIVALAKRFYLHNMLLNNQRMDTLIGTALRENPGSCRVMEKNGFTAHSTEVKFGAERRLYILDLRELF